MSGGGRLDRVARDIDRSKRASAPDTVIRHREVARPYEGVLARGARINRWTQNRRGGSSFKGTVYWQTGELNWPKLACRPRTKGTLGQPVAQTMVLLGRLQAVLQATVGNGLSFDHQSFGQDSEPRIPSKPSASPSMDR